jgi:pimeloyl-ACP methyl ester carboxylesterase
MRLGPIYDLQDVELEVGMIGSGLMRKATLLAIGLATAAACDRPSADAIAETTATATGETPARSGYVRVGDLDMYYEVHGEGRPLVLLHGGGSTIGTTFGRVLPAFAATRQVIAIETQGHGHTADIDRPLTFEQDADDVAGLIRQLGLGPVDVFGFSNGGNVALQIGIRHPEIVRKLVVASAFFEREGIHPEIRASFAQASVENMPEVLRAAYLEVAPDPANLPILVEKLMRRLTEFRDWPAEAIASIRAPTLVMLGDADVGPPEHAIRMTRLLPAAELAIFPGADHGAYLGEVTAMRTCEYCPEAVVAMVEAFLDAPMPAGR